MQKLSKHNRRNSQSIINPKSSSKNTVLWQKVTTASVNGKFCVEVISMSKVAVKISHQKFKKTIIYYSMLYNFSQRVL